MSKNITVKKVSKAFGSKESYQKVLQDVSTEFIHGKITAILGPSGSGKSTLLSIIGTLDFPTTGTIICNNKSINSLPGNEIANFRFNEIGFIFQQFHLIPTLSVLENVLSPLMMRKVSFDKKERALTLLSSVGLQDHVHKLPSQLSGGQQQRVAIARSLINEPSWILADEPTGNLDSETSKQVIELLKEIKGKNNCGIVIVTHDLELAEQADRIIEIQDGIVKSDHRRDL